ncbi:MAG: hypothetical protein IPH53_22750 [Flavobacteriales bacterium]|nr:hypothetical protein [Flavobacteriales bacterium]
MPVGDAVKGRLFNVVGAPIDGMKPVNTGSAIPSTASTEIRGTATSTEVLFTVSRS